MGENEAATKIQALWRGHYHGVPGLNDEEEDEEHVAREVRYDVNDLPPAFEDEKSYPKDHLMYHPKHGVQLRAYLKEIGAVRPEPSSQTQVEFDTAMIDDVMDENDGLEPVDFETAADNASYSESVEVVGAVEEEEEEEEEEEVEVQSAIDDVMDENDGLESVNFETAADNASNNDSMEEEEEAEEEEVEDQIAIDDVVDENDGLEP
eukprot:scaffold22453_cov61-Skeletonema_dohrnii-CCMP3373.AAC.1